MDYRYFLKRELNRRKARTKSYSLRAFARDLKVTSSRLSQILKGQLGLSEKAARQIASALDLDETERQMFLASVIGLHSRSGLARARAQKSFKQLQQTHLNKSISLDKNFLLESWHYLAILELSEVENFESKIPWIAGRLALDEHTIDSALNKLKAAGYLTERNGRLARTSNSTAALVTSNGAEVPNCLKELLLKSLSPQTANNDSEFFSLTLALDPAQIPTIRRRVLAFYKKLILDLSSHSSKKSVYHVSMQLQSLTSQLD